MRIASVKGNSNGTGDLQHSVHENVQNADDLCHSATCGPSTAKSCENYKTYQAINVAYGVKVCNCDDAVYEKTSLLSTLTFKHRFIRRNSKYFRVYLAVHFQWIISFSKHTFH